MKKWIVPFVVLCHMALLIGCGPTAKNSLRKDLLARNIPRCPVDRPITEPVILRFEDGAMKWIRGQCKFHLILEDMDTKEQGELIGTFLLETLVARVEEVVTLNFNIRLKRSLIRRDSQEQELTRNNINAIFQRNDLAPIFDPLTFKITLNRSAKEISIKYLQKEKTEKIEDDAAWQKFDEALKQSQPIKTGDKLFIFPKEAIQLAKLQNNRSRIESMIFKEEVKGITKIDGLEYLSTELIIRLSGEYYDNDKKDYAKISFNGGGYKLYEIPNLFVTKYVTTYYLDIDHYRAALGLSFDGQLTTIK